MDAEAILPFAAQQASHSKITHYAESRDTFPATRPAVETVAGRIIEEQQLRDSSPPAAFNRETASMGRVPLALIAKYLSEETDFIDDFRDSDSFIHDLVEDGEELIANDDVPTVDSDVLQNITNTDRLSLFLAILFDDESRAEMVSSNLLRNERTTFNFYEICGSIIPAILDLPPHPSEEVLRAVGEAFDSVEDAINATIEPSSCSGCGDRFYTISDGTVVTHHGHEVDGSFLMSPDHVQNIHSSPQEYYCNECRNEKFYRHRSVAALVNGEVVRFSAVSGRAERGIIAGEEIADTGPLSLERHHEIVNAISDVVSRTVTDDSLPDSTDVRISEIANNVLIGGNLERAEDILVTESAYIVSDRGERMDYIVMPEQISEAAVVKRRVIQ